MSKKEFEFKFYNEKEIRNKKVNKVKSRTILC